MKRRSVFFVCAACLLVQACPRTADHTEGWIREGRTVLFSVASENVPAGIYMPDEIWDEEAETARLDEGRFPDWARGAYSACVYWEGEYSRRELNQSRSPGEPTSWELQGSGRGWVLVGGGAPHILELILHDSDRDIVVVEAWDAPDVGG